MAAGLNGNSCLLHCPQSLHIDLGGGNQRLSQGLSKLISTYAPRAMKEVDVKKYMGRMVAIDASVMIYQYLVFVVVSV